MLAASVARIGRAGGVVAGQHLRLGTLPAPVLALADALDADLVVIGSRGLGSIGRLVLGSVSTALVHEARRPVLVLRGGATAWPPARVLIGADGSAASAQAAEYGVALGRYGGAAVTLTRVATEILKEFWYQGGRQTAYTEAQVKPASGIG